MLDGLSAVDSGWFLSRTVSGTSVLLLLHHHAESDSALQHLHREPRIDSGLILRPEREEEKQLLPETTLSHLVPSSAGCKLGTARIEMEEEEGGGWGVEEWLPMADVSVIIVKASLHIEV